MNKRDKNSLTIRVGNTTFEQVKKKILKFPFPEDGYVNYKF